MFVSYTFTNFLIVTCYLLPRVIFGFRFLYFLSTQRHKVAEYFFTNTDISDNTDVNHERKRDTCVACKKKKKIPLIWLICVQKKKETDLSDLSEIIKGVAFYHPFAFAVHRQKFCFE